MALIDTIATEFKMTKEQKTVFESYASERFAARTWASSYRPGISPNDEEFYMNMTNENLHAANVLNDLSITLWNLNLRTIFNELLDEEIREIVIGI